LRLPIRANRSTSGKAVTTRPRPRLKKLRHMAAGEAADQPVVQISRLLDERGLSSFQIKLIVWSFFIVLIDGYDIAAIAFAAPHLFAAMFGLPESIKYMALHESQRGKMEKLIAAIRPDFQVPANARFVVEDERQFPGFNPAYLFRDGLALITPLLWLLFALNLMGYFFLLSWTPTLLTAANLPPTTVALAGATLQVGGTVGALVLCWWLQRHRFLAIAIMFVIAVPVVGSIGFAGLTSKTALLTATFFAGFLVLGIQSGINVVGALIYPTSLRANGSGWQLGLGRIGSIVGPLVGALFVGLPVQTLYMWSALPFVVGAIVCYAIHRLNTARLAKRPELREAQ
jgi:AAHS family 4-hydroxybenzoate transporter-like MFS transporter